MEVGQSMRMDSKCCSIFVEVNTHCILFRQTCKCLLSLVQHCIVHLFQLLFDLECCDECFVFGIHYIYICFLYIDLCIKTALTVQIN